jgi:hypothetical protein
VEQKGLRGGNEKVARWKRDSEKAKSEAVACFAFLLKALVVAGVRDWHGERTACAPNFVLNPPFEYPISHAKGKRYL